MDEYISREAILSKCDNIWNNADETTQTGVDTINTIDEITDFIESLPTADVQPVNRGRWICEFYNDVFDVYQADCSVCKRESTDKYDKVSESYGYCPHCGARMDLKDGDKE